MVHQFPWWQHMVPELASSVVRGASVTKRDQEEPATVEEDEIEVAYAALEEKRREWELECETSATYFYTSILGGRWTKVHKKKAFDCIIGKARGGAPTTWARRYGLNVEASFAFSKYGDAAASSLALEWCSRMQYFFDMYVVADDSQFEY